MVVTILPILAAVLGALTYALSSNGKAAELGRLLFLAAALAFLLATAHVTVRLG